MPILTKYEGCVESVSETAPCSIVFVIRYFPPFIGGLEVNTQRLAEALANRGVSVTVVTGMFDLKLPRRETVRSVVVIRLPSPRIKILGAVVFVCALAWYLVKNRKRFDALHSFQIGYTAAVTVLFGKILRKPTVVTVASSGIGGDVARHRRTPLGRLFLILCRQASRMVILNQHMREELVAVGYPHDRAVFIPNGVDTAVFSPPTDSERVLCREKRDGKKIILYTGRLSPEKGVAFLITSFAELPPDFPAQLVVVGDGPEKGRLEKLVSRYRLETRVSLLPAVANVVPFLHSADIFVLPSQFEGLSNSLIEAMACGLPVIATQVVGTSEVIHDGYNGILVPYMDSSALAHAILFLCTHPDIARELGKEAAATVRSHYRLDRIALHYHTLYQELVKK